MDIKLEELLLKKQLYNLLKNKKNVYLRNNTDSDIAEKIGYRLELMDWLIYIDGNTLRKYIRGIGFGKNKISFCDDNGEICGISIEQLKKSNISNTEKSLLINGKSITLGDNSSVINKCLILLKSELNKDSVKKIRLAKLPDELWYLGYYEDVFGPFSKDGLINRIKEDAMDLNLIQLWSNNLQEWILLTDIPDLVEQLTEIGNSEESFVPVDINHCSKVELLKIPGFREDKVDAFIVKRNAGIQINNYFELQNIFELKPHELENIKNCVVIRVDSNLTRKGRVVDI